MPSKETVKKAYDFLDLSRGTQAFLNGINKITNYEIVKCFQADPI